MKDYKIFTPEKQIDGLNPIRLVSNANSAEEQIFIDFEVIDCTKESKELIERLAIIRGDCYEVCKGVVDKFIVIVNWSEPFSTVCIDLLKTYLNDTGVDIDKMPIFFIVAADYPNVMQIIGKLAEYGFATADHLVDLDNNLVMVKTTYRMFKDLSKHYFNKAFIID